MFRGKSSAFKTEILESSVDLFRFLAIVSPCFCLFLLLNPDSLWNPSICDIPKLFQYDLKKYHLVIQHSHGKSPCSIGKPSIDGPLSMAMLNNQRVSLKSPLFTAMLVLSVYRPLPVWMLLGDIRFFSLKFKKLPMLVTSLFFFSVNHNFFRTSFQCVKTNSTPVLFTSK